jgi:hypothetical protein
MEGASSEREAGTTVLDAAAAAKVPALQEYKLTLSKGLW